MVSAAWDYGEYEVAKKTLQKAIAEGQFEDSEHSVDLHYLGRGAAEARLVLWLMSRKMIDQSRDEYSILTGWGKHSSTYGHSVVKKQVQHLIAELELPFAHFDGMNPGKFVCTGAQLRRWYNRSGHKLERWIGR